MTLEMRDRMSELHNFIEYVEEELKKPMSKEDHTLMICDLWDAKEELELLQTELDMYDEEIVGDDMVGE